MEYLFKGKTDIHFKQLWTKEEKQMLNHDAKTSGGMTNFACNINAVTKWTMNKSAEAEITGELKQNSRY